MFEKGKADCPLWRGPCKEHACRWYIQVLGANPQTGEQMNQWDCAITWMPLLLIENSQQQRQTCGAVESFRNEMVKSNDRSLALMAGAQDMYRDNLLQQKT